MESHFQPDVQPRFVRGQFGVTEQEAPPGVQSVGKTSTFIANLTWNICPCQITLHNVYLWNVIITFLFHTSQESKRKREKGEMITLENLELMTVEEVARILRCEDVTIRRRIATGELTTVQFTRHDILITRASVEAYVQAHTRPGRYTEPALPAIQAPSEEKAPESGPLQQKRKYVRRKPVGQE